MPHERSESDRGAAPGAPGVSRRGFLKSIGTSALVAAAFGTKTVAKDLAEPEAKRELGPGAVQVTLTINGRSVTYALEPRVTLLEVLRNQAGLTGAKEACDRASCGACTVLRDGEPVNACSVLAIEAQGSDITTIEGLVAEAQASSATGRPLTKLQQALIDADGLQCGYCTPGFVIVLHALLKKNPYPTEAEIRQACAGNLCRCGSYPRVFAAVLNASGRTAGSSVTIVNPSTHALA